jgi:hypothetical protein
MTLFDQVRLAGRTWHRTPGVTLVIGVLLVVGIGPSQQRSQRPNSRDGEATSNDLRAGNSAWSETHLENDGIAVCR